MKTTFHKNEQQQRRSVAKDSNNNQKLSSSKKILDNRAEAIVQKKLQAIASKINDEQPITASVNNQQPVVQKMTGVKVITLNEEEIAANKSLAKLVIDLVKQNTLAEPVANTYCLLGRVVYKDDKGEYKGTYQDGIATFKFLEKSSDLRDAVVAHADQSLKKSGQYEKIKEGQKTTTKVYYAVDVDYYHKRALSKAAFHKDSTGTGMYVNLSFLNDSTIIGPEYIADIQGDVLNEGALQSQWYKDELASWRSSSEALEGAENIEHGLVPPGGMSVMNDATVVHSSPSLESRFNGASRLKNNHPYAPGTYENSVDGKKYSIKKNKKEFRKRRLSALLAKSKEPGNIDEKKIVEDTKNAERSFIRCEVKEISI